MYGRAAMEFGGEGDKRVVAKLDLAAGSVTRLSRELRAASGIDDSVPRRRNWSGCYSSYIRSALQVEHQGRQQMVNWKRHLYTRMVRLIPIDWRRLVGEMQEGC